MLPMQIFDEDWVMLMMMLMEMDLKTALRHGPTRFRLDDGLSDGDEVATSDGDGIADGDESTGGTDPLSADSDGDGLDDGTEGGNPTNADSDGDTFSDGDEVSE